MRIQLGSIALALGLAAAGCGNKSTCTEGASVACACPSGGTGAQVCTSGALGPCTCAAAPTPAAAPAPAPAPAPVEAPAPAAAPAPVAPAPAPAPAAAPVADDHDKVGREARERLDKLTKDAGEIDHKVAEAQKAVDRSKDEHERNAAKAQLAELQKRQTEMQTQLTNAKAEVDRAEHHDHDRR